MNEAQLKEWMRRDGFVPDGKGGYCKPKRTAEAVRPAPSAEPEQAAVLKRDGGVPRKAIYPGRVLVRITSFRCGTQLDPDNICPKFFIDCLRYAGIIRDDTRGCIELAPYKEERVSTKKEEGCLIEVIPL